LVQLIGYQGARKGVNKDMEREGWILLMTLVGFDKTLGLPFREKWELN
jgi:hypothetical protein